MTETILKSSKRSGTLDLLRFIAVLYVYFAHYADSFNYIYQIVPANLKYNPVIKYGDTALLIFFSVSGYVVTMTSIKKDLRVFFITRLSRIYPLFWVSCIVAFLLPRLVSEHTYLSQSSFKTFLVNLTMMPSVFKYEMINPIYHTLLAELIFYAFIGLIIAFRLWNRILIIIAALLVYCLSYGLSLEKSVQVFIIPYVAGMLFYLIRIKYDKPWKLYTLLGITYICLLNIGRILAHDVDLFFDKPGLVNPWIMCVVITFIYFLFHLISINKLNIKSTVVTEVLGQIAYPFYLFHIYFFYVYWYFSDKIQPDLLLIGLLFLIMIVAWILHVTVEIPFSQLLAKGLTYLADILSKIKRHFLSSFKTLKKKALNRKQQTAYLAKSLEDYTILNVKPDRPEKWEDGMRTDGGKGSYEWWYFDTHLEDGSKVVIVFYTKAMTEVNKSLKAYATLNIDYADGTRFERYLPSEDFSASKEQCDVTIGKCYFKGDLKTYQIHLEDHDFSFDVEFSNEEESWRPETGHLNFGDKGFHLSWFVAVPKGRSTVSYRIPGKTVNVKGTCYHDHNWGNKSLHKLVNHWYWSRSEFGPYTIIMFHIIPAKAFGHNPINMVYVSKDGIKIADHAEYLKVYRSYPVIAETGNKPISNDVLFTYEEGDLKLDLHLSRTRDIMQTYLIYEKFKRELIKTATGFNGAYFRITGNSILQVYDKELVKERFENSNSIWELMYFGNPI
ncbi:peptidoglycan/LPS O-acetylase OafA/YrhL [Pedobacter sp. AK017]|uniref:acyltransferase family protein n=1 Tax=Pedobacter sp. AK017 TaxID=2723073 RepID=UPI00161B7192|nr:acyltransferase family protein [Pedobacter sp. AK017]MBB5440352.1 peptidoglycan/LPS O-acetylase OafA/YrhL [Pedobacter sp. AK017]